jgi:hypothetical protein
VSHVIVHYAEDGAPPRTMKFLMGISRNNCVVNVDWATECLKRNCLVDEVTAL